MRLAAILGVLALLMAGACSGSGEDDPTPNPLATSPNATLAPVTQVAPSATPQPTSSPVPSATTVVAPTAVEPPAPTRAAGGATNPQPATQPPRPANVSLVFVANNLAFDRTSVTVASGAGVTATLQNDDTGIEHNLTFSIPGLPHGATCAGPCTRTQSFEAPAPGSYFFLCTIHDMSGTLLVQ